MLPLSRRASDKKGGSENTHARARLQPRNGGTATEAVYNEDDNGAPPLDEGEAGHWNIDLILSFDFPASFLSI